MLKRLRVNNFKSLLNVEFRPVGVNLVIGPNNAGKTNLCSAMRLLSLTSSESLEMAVRNALGETWNVMNVYIPEGSVEMEVDCSLSHEGVQLEFNYRLQIALEKSAAIGRQPLRVDQETLTVTGGEFHQALLLENRQGQAHLLHEERGFPVDTLSPTDATMLCRLYDLETNRRANLFKRFLKSWEYFNLSPAALRSPTVVRDAPGILADGRNLTRTFFALHNEKPRLERKIIDVVRMLEPKLDLFSYTSPDPESVYLFLEDEQGNRFSTQSISDGTLRFMAMSYLILSASADDGNGSTARVVVIEEPENGLYVGHLKPLLQGIDPQGRDGQFIFTTHSPYFIDLFDDNLEGLHLMKPGRPSSVLTKPDADTVRVLLDQMPLGELHYREMLG